MRDFDFTVFSQSGAGKERERQREHTKLGSEKVRMRGKGKCGFVFFSYFKICIGYPPPLH